MVCAYRHGRPGRSPDVLLLRQSGIDSGWIETAQAFFPNNDDGQRTQAHAHQFLHGLRVSRHVFFCIRHTFTR